MKNRIPFVHEKLVCIDSDGCAFDSMEAKHRRCFGPQIMNVWSLEAKADQVLEKWNEVNLYSCTRAINRFKALVLVLKAFDEPDWKVINEWTERVSVLSNVTLSQEKDPALCRALKWSIMVNDAIAAMPTALPFDGVREGIIQMAETADIVVISSTNPAALEKEWTNAGLRPYISQIMSHRDGSKKKCIASLLQKGYKPQNIIMLGDAPGDYQAAYANEVHFYPILPKKEVQSWKDFFEKIYPKFISGFYSGATEAGCNEEFLELFT